MKRNVLGVILLVLVLSPGSPAQEAQTPETPDRVRVLEAARDLMQRARYCVLVTIGEDGHPQARIMDPFAPEDGMVVWAATNPVTRKVAQIRNDPRVTLTYFDAERPGYVTLLGTAELVDDPAEKARRWKPGWKALYQDENRGSDYLLIRIRPGRLEMSSRAHGITNHLETNRPTAITFP